MSSSAKVLVMAALGLGVFLIGVELMVTVVALPQDRRVTERLDPAAARVVDR